MKRDGFFFITHPHMFTLPHENMCCFALFHKLNETAQKIVKHIVIQGFRLLILCNALPEKLIAAL